MLDVAVASVHSVALSQSRNILNEIHSDNSGDGPDIINYSKNEGQ